jgi:hypothetical protein
MWHFCLNCKDWPTKDFDEISSAANPPWIGSVPNARSWKEAKNAKVLTKLCPSL